MARGLPRTRVLWPDDDEVARLLVQVRRHLAHLLRRDRLDPKELLVEGEDLPEGEFRPAQPRHPGTGVFDPERSEEHTSELQSRFDLVCRLLLEKKKN